MGPKVEGVGHCSGSAQLRTDPRGESAACQLRVSAAKEGLQP